MSGSALNAVRWGFKQQVITARSNVDGYQRERDDFYPTPPEATEALLSVESFKGRIWEPACGDGAISKVVSAAGYDVVSTDLINRGYGESQVDFLLEWSRPAPNIITNPPFKLSRQFAEHALRLTTGKVAMLNKLAFLEGQDRRRLMTTTPLARVWVFSRRLAFPAGSPHAQSKGGGMLAFAWFVWEHGYTGKPTLGWL